MARFSRSLLLGTACLACSFGAATAQDPVPCPAGLNCSATGADVAHLQPIVDGVVGQALLALKPAPNPDQPSAPFSPTLSAIVGVSWNGQRTYFGYGRNAPPYGPRTIVELGSITKVFTTALFSEAVLQRNLDLDAKLSTYQSAIGLPGLTWCGSQATLRELANFSSGMPDEPGNRPAPNDAVLNGILLNGAPNYTVQDFKSWVAGWQPAGTKLSPPTCPLSSGPDPYAYSNASIGLLGYIAAYQFGAPWARALDEHVFGPLGMASTFAPAADGSVPAAAKPRIAAGRGSDYQTVVPWPLFAWYAAGALRSDAMDALSFGEAGLGDQEIDGAAPPPQAQKAVTALHAAIAMGQNTTYPVNDANGNLRFQQGFAWVQQPAQPALGYVPLWYKNGGTDGFSTFLILNRAKNLTVFIAVGQTGTNVNTLGIQLARKIN